MQYYCENILGLNQIKIYTVRVILATLDAVV